MSRRLMARKAGNGAARMEGFLRSDSRAVRCGWCPGSVDQYVKIRSVPSRKPAVIMRAGTMSKRRYTTWPYMRTTICLPRNH